MKLSVNFRTYDLERARAEKDYARLFTSGWEVVETKSAEYFKHLITNFVWSPILFRDGYRKTENFLSSQFLVLDFDTPDYPMAQAEREWCDQVHWIGTTRNHQREKKGITCDRYRLIAPFERQVEDMWTLRHNHTVAITRYDADPLPKDQARLFFPCQEIVSVSLDGDLQRILEPPPKKEPRPLPPSGISLWTLLKLQGVIPEGERNTTAYRIAKDLYRTGKDFEEILNIILASATYKGSAPRQVVLELESVVRSAVKSVAAEKGK